LYNILEYKHKKIIPQELKNFSDSDFKKQVILNFKNKTFTNYDLLLFFKHIRNINLCLNKLFKQYKKTTEDSLLNSIIFLYENYLESFIDSIFAHYFHCTATNEKKQEVLNVIMYNAWEKIYK
jgi:hypothetical protein